MATARTDTDILLDALKSAIDNIQLNTDGLELSVGGKYDSSGNRGGGLTNGDIVPVSINASGETIVALSATDNGVLDTVASGVLTDDAAFTLGSGKGTMMMGFAGTQSVDANDSGAVAMETNGSLHVAATNIVPGVAATNLGKAEDAAAASGDTGVMALVVRKDIAECLAQDGDYQPMQCDVDGTIRTQNTFGTWGTILVNDTTAVTCAVHDRDFVAIYMLTDTVFASGAGGLSAKTAQLYLDDTNTSTDIDSDAGTAIDGITFPAGMTLYGRYEGFTLASGSVIAYVG